MLLILAAVSIAMLSGDNSILRRAKSAVGYNYVGAAKDEVSLAYNSAYAKYLTNRYTEGTTDDDKNLAKLMAKELKAHVASNNQKSHECKVEYSETEVSTVKLTYTDDQGTSYKATGMLTTTIGKENFTWGGISTGNGEDSDALTVGQAYDDVLIKIGDKFKYTGDTQTEWIVFGKDDKDNVLLTTKSAVQDKKFTLTRDPQHWLSYETDLHTHCANLYGNASKGITARSITLEDINRVTGYTEPALNPYTFGAEQKYEERKVNYYYPTTETATATTNPYWKKATGTADSKTFTETHEPYSYSNLDVSNQNAKYVLGGYWDAGHENEGTDSEYYHPYEDYVVASRSVYVLSDGAYFRNSRVYDGYVYSGYADFLYTYEWGNTGGPPISVSVRPIVVISPDILVFEGLDGVYEVVE